MHPLRPKACNKCRREFAANRLVEVQAYWEAAHPVWQVCDACVAGLLGARIADSLSGERLVLRYVVFDDASVLMGVKDWLTKWTTDLMMAHVAIAEAAGFFPGMRDKAAGNAMNIMQRILSGEERKLESVVLLITDAGLEVLPQIRQRFGNGLRFRMWRCVDNRLTFSAPGVWE